MKVKLGRSFIDVAVYLICVWVFTDYSIKTLIVVSTVYLMVSINEIGGTNDET